MARPALDTVPMDLEEAASLIEQTRTGVPGEEEPAPRRPERPPGDIRPRTDQAKDATITKTLVSAQDDVRAALAAGREVRVDLAEASEPPQPTEPATFGDVQVINPYPDVAPGGFRPHAALGDKTFASSEGGGAAFGATPSARRAPGPSRWLLPIVAAVSFCVVFGIALLILMLRGSLFGSPRPGASATAGVPPTAAPTSTAIAEPSSTPTATPSSTVAVAPTSTLAAAPPSTPTATPTATPTSTPTEPTAAPSAAPTAAPSLPLDQPSSSTPAEAEARAALTRLGEGIATCARDTIGVLPGTSPAVPFTLALVQRGPYPSIPRDWSTPVWTCAKFRLEAPQRFQIQWQIVKPSLEGMGIAWLDDNADGKPDRALGFRATLKQRGEPEIGPIELLSPVPPVAPPPR
jgi:hypothetical protein